jgi:hypothetical protein
MVPFKNASKYSILAWIFQKKEKKSGKDILSVSI